MLQVIEGGAGTSSLLQVYHLPPLDLHLVFSPLYPTHEPPQLSLRTSWLSTAQLDQLHAKMLDIWELHKGEPICYIWASWLRESALEYLGITDVLQLGDLPPSNLQPEAAHTSATIHHRGRQLLMSTLHDQNSSQPEQAMAVQSTCTSQDPSSSTAAHVRHRHAHAKASADTDEQSQSSSTTSRSSVLQQLQEYDAARRRALFSARLWTCHICFEEVTPELPC